MSRHGSLEDMEEVIGQPLLLVSDQTVSTPSKLPQIDLSRRMRDEADALAAAQKSGKTRYGSVSIIFSIVSTMLGTSVLTFPFGVFEAGWLAAPLISFAICCLNTTGALLIVRTTSTHTDIMQYSASVLGRWTLVIGTTAIVLIMLGAAIASHGIMTQLLYSIVVEVLGVTHLEKLAPWWRPSVAAVIVCLVAIILLLFANLTFLTKIGSAAFFSIIYLIFFTFVKFALALFHGDIQCLPPAIKRTAPELAGLTVLGLFIHNGLLSFMNSHRTPKYRERDTVLAFGLTWVVQLTVGMLGYWSMACSAPGQPSTFMPQDYLDAFPADDLFAFSARVALLVVMLCVFPIVVFLLRSGLPSLLVLTPVTARLVDDIDLKYIPRQVVNVIVMIITLLFAILYNNVATVLRYVGAFTGFVFVFVLPVLLYRQKDKSRGKWTWLKVLLGTVFILIGFFILLTQFLS